MIQIFGRILVERAHQTCFVIIDALDESEEDEHAELLSMIRNITSLESVGTRILVTSRTNTIGVEDGLKDVTRLFDIAIERRQVDNDIAAHITERLQNDEVLKKWPMHVREAIKETLTENAAGMFRWADCQLQAVRKCRKLVELKRTLTSLPKDLHEAYTRELSSARPYRSGDVRKLLEWLTFPQRPYVHGTVSQMECTC